MASACKDTIYMLLLTVTYRVSFKSDLKWKDFLHILKNYGI